MEKSRADEQRFVEFLNNSSALKLKRGLGEELFDYTERQYFEKLVSSMTNSFLCNEQRIVDAITQYPNAIRCFQVLAMHYVKQCACRYKHDYWDDRDKSCVTVCHRIAELDSFRQLYEKVCVEEYTKDAGPCPGKETTKAVALIGTLSDLHSTLRQTFGNVVLTFLLSQNANLKHEVLKHEILHSERVHFFMI